MQWINNPRQHYKSPRQGLVADALENESITYSHVARYLGIPAMLLMQLQADYDLGKANRSKGKEIERTVPKRLAKVAS